MLEHSTYIEASLWLPKTNVLASKTNDLTPFIHYTCSCAASTYINADVVVLLDIDIIVRIE